MGAHFESVQCFLLALSVSLQVAKRHENDTFTDEPMTDEQVREVTAYILPFVRGYFKQAMVRTQN